MPLIASELFNQNFSIVYPTLFFDFVIAPNKLSKNHFHIGPIHLGTLIFKASRISYCHFGQNERSMKYRVKGVKVDLSKTVSKVSNVQRIQKIDKYRTQMLPS